ncbi:ABC transporter permease [Bogoriella caseilytica]|uniref:Peptide/nickel transport system permease protein n=1 Tax=Bogoriella caseilytica TaxID=56055 RepID=A0A3N2BD76_9MICO|nr:ABC transporter permease [Bogoriella caseilytica]ROR73210.1 peptide/nickel transport system permease protein [Bogoriella caseilytica]
MTSHTTAALPAGSESAGNAPGEKAPRSSSGFGRYLINRISGTIVSLIAIVFSAFFIFRVLPGNPVENLMAEFENPSPELQAALIEEWGLNDPLPVQFWNYLTGLLQGNLGTSIQFGVPVNQLFADRLFPTLLLGGVALILAVILGYGLGAQAAWRHGTGFDRRTVYTALVFFAAPTFWVAMIAIIIFSRELRLFPTGRMRSAGAGDNFFAQFLDVGYHMILPTVTLTLMMYSGYLLTMRAAMLDEMGNDYLTTARAKGLRDNVVQRKHAMRNAMLPTTTVVFMSIGNLINGSLITEMIFSWPGLGYTFYQAISVPDYPVLQGLFVIFAGSTVLANLAADIMYWFIDPRARKA